MNQHCGFIEVFKSKNRPRLVHSPEPQPIKMMDKSLKEIQQSKELKLVAVWKIKLKPNAPAASVIISGSTIQGATILLAEPSH